MASGIRPAAQRYSDWSATCDTLHALTQVLGKLAVSLAAPEPQLQHAALQLTARGWETLALPAPNGSGAIGVTLDLRRHEIAVEHSDGRVATVALVPARPVGEVTRDVLDAVRRFAGEVAFDPTPQEVDWAEPLDADTVHRSYDTAAVARYFHDATFAAQVLAAYRAAYRGRRTPVNAWWGSFDLAVSLFSGEPAAPPSEDFIMRNAMDAQEVAAGWWPGDEKHPEAAFYLYAYPAPDGYGQAQLSPDAVRWSDELGEYVLDMGDIAGGDDPFGAALEFLRSGLDHSCSVCGWNPALPASAAGDPPPVS